jgi:hypothetical protein
MMMRADRLEHLDYIVASTADPGPVASTMSFIETRPTTVQRNRGEIERFR